MELLAVGGFLAVTATIVALAIAQTKQAARQRSDALRAFAESTGWDFREEVPYDSIPNIERFELFGTGHSRKLRNLLTSPAGAVRAVVFDYAYTISSGKTQVTHAQTVFYATSDHLDLPVYSLRPETFFHRVGAMLGYQDIDLEHTPEFSRLFLLRGAEEPRVREVFNENVTGFFEARAGVCAAGTGRELLFWRPGKLIPPEEMHALIQDGFELAASFSARDSEE